MGEWLANVATSRVLSDLTDGGDKDALRKPFRWNHGQNLYLGRQAILPVDREQMVDRRNKEVDLDLNSLVVSIEILIGRVRVRILLDFDLFQCRDLSLTELFV